MKRVRGAQVMPGEVVEEGEVYCVVDKFERESWIVSTRSFTLQKVTRAHFRDATPAPSPAPGGMDAAVEVRVERQYAHIVAAILRVLDETEWDGWPETAKRRLRQRIVNAVRDAVKAVPTPPVLSRPDTWQEGDQVTRTYTRDADGVWRSRLGIVPGPTLDDTHVGEYLSERRLAVSHLSPRTAENPEDVRHCGFGFGVDECYLPEGHKGMHAFNTPRTDDGSGL